MDWTTLGLIVAAIILICQYLWKVGTRGHDIFEKQRIPYVKALPFIGSNLLLLRGKISLQDYIRDLFKEFPDARIIGTFDRRTPNYVIKDAELLKQIAFKDYEYFMSK